MKVGVFESFNYALAAGISYVGVRWLGEQTLSAITRFNDSQDLIRQSATTSHLEDTPAELLIVAEQAITVGVTATAVLAAAAATMISLWGIRHNAQEKHAHRYTPRHAYHADGYVPRHATAKLRSRYSGRHSAKLARTGSGVTQPEPQVAALKHFSWSPATS